MKNFKTMERTLEKPGSKIMGQKPLEPWLIRQINKLIHEHGLKRMVVVRRLGISRSAVRTHLVSPEQWLGDKKKDRSS